ncbi:DUF2865 domain-containing protein [Pannonibacter sp.]|uniref:DUF2865 domain-containing protein n=1 Tax=Pannonibacter sp. TaxID=1906786 RepID=UPI003F6EE9C9
MTAVGNAALSGLRLLVLWGTVCLAAGAAEARTAACDGLERQLARAQGASQSSAGSKWDEAARQQAAAITAAERDAAYFRCQAQPGTPKCAGLIDKIGRMKGNLAKIERQRAKSNPTAARGAKDIARLQTALVRNRCSETPARVEKARAGDALEAQKPSGLLNRIFSSSEPDDRPVRITTPQPAQQLAATSRASETIGERRSRAQVTGIDTSVSRLRVPTGGTFRTLCVRTCDGYFFPISFSTSSDKFPQDAQICASMCPAAETDLFIYPNPGGEPENMMSLAGIAYKDLPNAFRHRKEYVEGCSCQAKPAGSGTAGLKAPGPANMTLAPLAGTVLPARGAYGLGGEEDPRTGSLRAAISPIPLDVIPEDADPDTRQNLSEGFDATALVSLEAPAGTATGTTLGTLPAPELEVRGAARSETASAEEAGASSPETATPAPTAPRGPVRQVGPKFYPDR